MVIKFEKDTHTYLLDGNFADISVTELLTKHGLAPNLSRVPKATLKAKADKGTQIHKDLENVLNKANYSPKTIQGEKFAEWVHNNLQCGVGEQMLGYEYNTLRICGTADVVGFMKDGSLLVGDHKTTAKFEEEYVSWQVSLLDYFARALNGQKINGKAWHWKGATKFICFWYNNEELTIKELTKVDDSEIERLLECEFKGEIYQRPQLVVPQELREQFEQAELCLIGVEQQYKQAKAYAEKLREQLQVAMEEQNIRSFETDKVKLIYIPQNDRYSVDSTKLRREYPLVYQECCKLTQVKPSVRIKIKGDGNNADE